MAYQIPEHLKQRDEKAKAQAKAEERRLAEGNHSSIGGELPPPQPEAEEEVAVSVDLEDILNSMSERGRLEFDLATQRAMVQKLRDRLRDALYPPSIEEM